MGRWSRRLELEKAGGSSEGAPVGSLNVSLGGACKVGVGEGNAAVGRCLEALPLGSWVWRFSTTIGMVGVGGGALASAGVIDSAVVGAQAWISSGSEEVGEGGAGIAVTVEVAGLPWFTGTTGGRVLTL